MSIIGGADGPTSIFIAKKSNNKIKKIEDRRNKIINQLPIDPHSVSQLIEYIAYQYSARKANEEENSYKFAFQNIKSQLVLKYKPELVMTPQPDKLGNYINKKKVEQYFHQIEQRNLEAANVRKEEFEINFEQYIIQVNKDEHKGMIQIDVEYNYNYFAVSYSGQEESLEYMKIVCDLYKYYGVSKEDIVNRTDRLMNLVCCLEHMNE